MYRANCVATGVLASFVCSTSGCSHFGKAIALQISNQVLRERGEFYVEGRIGACSGYSIARNHTSVDSIPGQKTVPLG